jgi:hypothetical protein
MTSAAFEWNDYEVPAGAGDGTLELLADAASTTVTVALPDLSPWPTPLGKAEILLQSAAEIEHALMVQYLYAAYSLKGSADVSDAAQKAVLTETSPTAWPQVLLGIAREEMGHLMTVQNLLLLVGLAPNFEREDFPPRKDLYPFALHLEPLTQRSLAKYVVAEAPSDAAGIDDIVALATDSAGSQINHVGVLYGLLGLVFSAPDVIDSGDAEWDTIVGRLSVAAYQQSPPESWHLHDEDFKPRSLARQGDPDHWQVAHLRVHRMADRAGAVQAIRDIGEQGEGPTGGDELSHFARFLGIFRGHDGIAPFPEPGSWLPTRDVQTDPKVQDIANSRTRRWVELGDIRYGLLLGFLEHYLLASAVDRGIFTGWIFAEMRSRVGYLARQLPTMPRAAEGGGPPAEMASIAFTLPADLHLPDDEAARWAVHGRRTEAAIAKVQEMRSGDPVDGQNAYLADLLASDLARLALITDRHPGEPVATSFIRDIKPLFRTKDVQHMNFKGVDLATYDGVRASAEFIRDRVRGIGGPMPPAPDQPWTAAQGDLFARWIDDGFPA